MHFDECRRAPMQGLVQLFAWRGGTAGSPVSEQRSATGKGANPADTIVAGMLAGPHGGKDTAPQVADRSRLFVTVTALSFRPMHLGPDRHGQPAPAP